MNRHSQTQRGTFWLPIPFLAAVFVAIASSPSKANTFGTLYISTNTTLTDNHEGDVVITTDNITLDCGGHVISADLPVGILVQDRSNVTIRNCEVSGFTRGVLVLNSIGNTLLANTANHNDYGFALAFASGNQLIGNTANNNSFAGFGPGRSVGNTFSANTANLNGTNGFEIHLYSDRNVFSENTANNNGAAGFGLGSSSNNHLAGDIANGNNGSGFGLSQSNSNILEDNTAIRNAFAGFALGESSSNTLLSNRAKNNLAGFYLTSSSFNTLESNDGTPNTGVDAYQSGGTGNVSTDNKFKTTDGF
ncbi:MAG TPA: right-handed parallel beta-helix repeat-containing protein [Vicinamibacterales bacterium]|nr:right-handed parallel beta-helix repeat-containing protein [Vicinamibacterales bacterium]